jgi:hypothetical protein
MREEEGDEDGCIDIDTSFWVTDNKLGHGFSGWYGSK